MKAFQKLPQVSVFFFFFLVVRNPLQHLCITDVCIKRAALVFLPVLTASDSSEETACWSQHNKKNCKTSTLGAYCNYLKSA